MAKSRKPKIEPVDVVPPMPDIHPEPLPPTLAEIPDQFPDGPQTEYSLADVADSVPDVPVVPETVPVAETAPVEPEPEPVTIPGTQLRPYMVTYRLRSFPEYRSSVDIGRDGRGRKMEPPPWFFRRAGGFRPAPLPEPGDEPGTTDADRGDDGSVWFFADESWIPHQHIHEMRTEFGCRNIMVIPMDPACGPQIAAMAVHSLRAALNAQSQRTMESVKNAESMLHAELVTADLRDRDLRDYRNRTKVNMKKLAEWIEHTETACRAFGLDTASIVGGHRETFGALMTGIRARIDAWNAATRELQRMGNAAMADAVRAGGVPAAIVSDALRDAGSDVMADVMAG